MKRRRLLIVGLSLSVLLVLGYFFLPYSLGDFKRIKAVQLRNELKQWRLLDKPSKYGRTNSVERCFLVRTNISDARQTIEGVMILESDTFQEKGLLISTENGEVYWYNGKKLQHIN